MNYYDKLTHLGIKVTRIHASEKTQCPKCYDGRKNKIRKDLSVNITTGEYKCHNTPCDFMGNVRTIERRDENKVYTKPDKNLLQSIKLGESVSAWFSKRKISQQTLDRYLIHSKKEKMPQTGKLENCICFPYIQNAELTNIKFRDGAKNFKMIAGAKLVLFGLQFLGQKKHVIITEGEPDCLAVSECGYGLESKEVVDTDTGEVTEEQILKDKSKWCPLSVPNGTSDKGELKLEYLDNCFEELIGIHEFIIAVDDDKAGDLLKYELIRRLGVERCRFITYPKQEVVPLENNLKRKCKDLNEVLQYLGEAAVDECIQSAKFIPIEGVYYLQDLYPKMLENFKRGIILAPTTRFGNEMDKLFRRKKGELNLGVGYGNHGKTQFATQGMLVKSIYDDWRWGVFCPENYPATDFYDDLVEPFVGKWLSRMTEEEYEFACRFLQEHFFYVYPEDEHDLFSIHERFRNLVMKKGIDGVLIDPWNQLDRKFGQYGMTGEERLSVDLKQAKRFALLNNVEYNILAHPKNPEYINKVDKQLPVVGMYDIAGGAQWGNKIDNIWSLYRPNWHVERNDPSVEIHFQKIKRKRTGGSLGTISMHFDWNTKRFVMQDGFIPCDPKSAEKIIRAENFDTGITGKLFFDDDTDEEDLPF